VYGQAGGHAGCDENGYILALDPEMVKQDDYHDDLVYQFIPGVSTYPYPGPVLIYKEGEGAPDFDQDKAHRYRNGAIEKVKEYLLMILDRWDKIE